MGCERTLTRRDVLALGVGAGVTAGLGGPWLRRVSAKETTVKASYFTISALMQYYAAKERGFFKEEGIKLEDTFVPGHLIMQGLVSGQVDFTFTNTVDITRINLQGVSVKILYPGAVMSHSHPYAQIAVPEGSTIKTAKELEGRKIAVASVRSTIDLAVINWLATNGADPAKVNIVAVGFDGIIPAIRSKQFDAVYAIEPELAIIKGQKLGELIGFPHGALGSQVLVTGYIAREAWIEKNPETAQTIVRALDKTTQWLMAHPGEIPGIITRNTRIKEDLARQMILPGLTRVARKVDLQPFVDVAAKFKFIERSPDVCTLFSKYCPKEC